MSKKKGPPMFSINQIVFVVSDDGLKVYRSTIRSVENWGNSNRWMYGIRTTRNGSDWLEYKSEINLFLTLETALQRANVRIGRTIKDRALKIGAIQQEIATLEHMVVLNNKDIDAMVNDVDTVTVTEEATSNVI